MNNKKTGLWIVILVLAFGLLAPLAAAAEKRDSKVRFFSKNSVYLYAQGAVMSLDASFVENSLMTSERVSDLAGVIGVGCRILNMGNYFFFNMEFDATIAGYDYSSRPELQVNYYTLMLDAEFRIFRRSPISIFLGVGGSIVHFSEVYRGEGNQYYGNEIKKVVVAEIGAKYPLSKKLYFKTGIRVFGEVDPDVNNDYWDDYWDKVDENSSVDPFSSSLSVGLEYHF